MYIGNTFNDYVISNIFRELEVIDLRIKTLPDSKKKEAALLKSKELKKIIMDIEKEVK